MYGGMCHGSYAFSLTRVISVLQSARISVRLGHLENASLITLARDFLADEFLTTDCTHLMFIDSDIGFRAEDIVSMVAADKDIILGSYARKGIDWERVAAAAKQGVLAQELHRYAGVSVVTTLDGAGITGVAPVEVAGGGMGFTLIKREVFHGLASKVRDYDELGRYRMKHFFASIVEGGRMLGEDEYFYKLARDNGYRVWAAPWVELTHTGSYKFT
jgi:hypothetical protein